MIRLAVFMVPSIQVVLIAGACLMGLEAWLFLER